MEGYKEIIKSLLEIKAMSFVKTHRAGNTGIGKTIEDLLGVKENNVPGPNHKMLELKSARMNTKSMLTLFTKSPLPEKANSMLLKKFGYYLAKETGKKELHTTVNAVSYNKLNGKIGFKIQVKKSKLELVSKNKVILGYWDKETLRNCFEKKLQKVLYVKAQNRGNGSKEEFWFKEAWVLGWFDFDGFVKLLEQGIIVVDIRIGQYANGKTHDHGTAFRVHPGNLEKCFKHRQKIM